jgi:uncharacterized protein (DUF885 family)
MKKELPMDIWKLSEEYVKESLELDPIGSTYLGDPSRDHLWTELSLEASQEVETLRQKYLKALKDSFPQEPTIPEEWVAYRVFKESLERASKAFQREEYYYNLNTITSTFQVFRSIFDVMKKSTEKEWRNILSRLEKLPSALKQYEEVFRHGIKHQKTVAKSQIKKIVQQARVLSTYSEDLSSNYFLRLVQTMNTTSSLSENLKKELAQGMIPAAQRVNQAIQSFADFLEKEYYPHATEKDGVGESRYRYYAENFLGTTLNPQEAYQWGWKEYYRLEEEMKRVAKEIDPSKTMPEVLRAIAQDESLMCPSQEAFAQLILERQKQAIQDLDGTHFDIPKEAKTIEVKLAPSGISRGASYQGPSEDFSRCGQIWYSFGKQQKIPSYSEIATAYHEGFPGHHLQVCIAHLQREKLSRFHRLFFWCPGYGEGWALYTERLMGELGYYDKKEFYLGMLNEQLRRSFRIVVDIGMHLSLPIPTTEAFHPGEVWNAELGEKFMVERVFANPEDARDEIARYLGWPGQAICYKLGEKVFLELREYAQKELQSAFNLKWFHHLVLEMGPLSLDMLKTRVTQEVKMKKRA